ncbi:MAG TPA: hypothetical protein VGM57_16470 [Pseudolabrys sp.]
MFRWMVLATAALALFTLGGCASDDVGPSKAELKAKWDSENIYPQAYKSDLLAFLRSYINEPSGVRGAAVSAPVLKDVGPGERYYTCVRYNERKSTGGYAGSKDGVAVYVSGKLDRFFDQSREVLPFCKEVAFVPFPELEALKR